MAKSVSPKVRRHAKKASRGVPVSSEIARAAERAGIEPRHAKPEIEALQESLTALRDERKWLGAQLRYASDLVAEYLAAVEAGESDGIYPATKDLLTIHMELWRLRWDLGEFAEPTGTAGGQRPGSRPEVSP